jgi:hypothetical protein
MVIDKQVRALFGFLLDDQAIGRAGRLANMAEKAARKYRKLCKLPSEVVTPHDWRTRPNPFVPVWEETRGLLRVSPY